MNYQEAVLELYFSLRGRHQDNFHALLYRLIQKADPHNRALLRLGFSEEVRAWEAWQDSENEDEFFKPFLPSSSKG